MTQTLSRNTFLLGLGLAVLSSAAIAHAAVTDPTVKARMQGMKDIRTHYAIMGDMVKGKTEFDAAAAQAAMAELAIEAENIPALFADPAADPESEAKPAIWDNMDDFAQKADALYAAAMAADTSSLDGARASMKQIGMTCKACHDDYKD
ncbi:hypothetical protein BFP70_00990 [Thioclava sp. SK-1]|uniref:c-type cytochrome n=1 Tax=Thioclava sp. SK-1 TaxID=1889770 RepID=UPI00082550C2|nr:cytochrome c [Thioclava sp. SK-1]OCX66764.1 hypothetical protein BFP70_00990 [Thioclava sp. SK-1]